MSLIDDVNAVITLFASHDILVELDRYEWVSSEIIDHLRWDVVMRDIITDGNEYVELVYNLPATEDQDSDLDMRTRVVKPVQKYVTVFE